MGRTISIPPKFSRMYECVTSFKSFYGAYYTTGQLISDNVYRQQHHNDKRKFRVYDPPITKKSENETPVSNGPDFPSMADLKDWWGDSNTSTPDTTSNDSTSSSDFGGFDGGDSGGGGASGEW